MPRACGSFDRATIVAEQWAGCRPVARLAGYARMVRSAAWVVGSGMHKRITNMQFCGPDPNSHATTMYREMDMRFWLEKAEVEMKALA
jgi:hypothetical protein